MNITISTLTLPGLLFVTLVGLVMYGYSTEAKPTEIGRLTFACGLLAMLLAVALGHH